MSKKPVTTKHKKGEYCPESPRNWVDSKNMTSKGIARCPTCRRRLKASAKFCVGGEFVGYKLPPHKLRKATLKKYK